MNQNLLKVLRGMQVLEGVPNMRVQGGLPSMSVIEGVGMHDNKMQAQTAAATIAMLGLVQQENSMDNGSSISAEVGGSTVSPATIVNRTVAVNDTKAMGMEGGGGTITQATISNGTMVVYGTGNQSTSDVQSSYLAGLLHEKRILKDTEGMDLTKRLLGQEIEKLQTSGKSLLVKTEDRRLSDVTKDKAVKLSIRVLVPVRDHPKFNFVGKLLGPRGNSLKKLQEDTMTKMAILGRGSMKDKIKEEELRQTGDPKFIHLEDDLHVEVTAVAPPAEAHARLAYALTELRRYLVPDYNDDIRQQQMREIKLMNVKNNNNTSNSNSVLGNTTTNNDNDLGNTSGSEEGSCSPKSGGSPIPSATLVNNDVRQMRTGIPMQLPSPHTTLRNPHAEQQLNMANNVNAGSMRRTLANHHSSRRSVLTLLSRARAIQRKELQFMDVCHDLPASGSYGSMQDHINEIPLSDSAAEELTDMGHMGVGLLKASSPVDRTRFRHEPYHLP